ncbi:hypothetical protein AMATHDRAFT_62548 [Amanita thiersii Skay4041]|uniref:Uncharacterized protein n=1 Tax=Amanita thiersii Skay4041 TaxID=703135 RepID=A0A2A9NPR4_9AGAR|nr:hypothetical protein AMATHDRAFT_62548 [Amanita thiersii Skay4041]
MKLPEFSCCPSCRNFGGSWITKTALRAFSVQPRKQLNGASQFNAHDAGNGTATPVAMTTPARMDIHRLIEC